MSWLAGWGSGDFESLVLSLLSSLLSFVVFAEPRVVWCNLVRASGCFRHRGGRAILCLIGKFYYSDVWRLLSLPAIFSVLTFVAAALTTEHTRTIFPVAFLQSEPRVFLYQNCDEPFIQTPGDAMRRFCWYGSGVAIGSLEKKKLNWCVFGWILKFFLYRSPLCTDGQN